MSSHDNFPFATLSWCWAKAIYGGIAHSPVTHHHHHLPSGLANNGQQICREQSLHAGVLTLTGHCSKVFPQPKASGFWCKKGLSLPSHPSDPQHCASVPALGWLISRRKTSWLLTPFSLPSDSAAHQSPVYTPDCEDHKIHQGFLHARRQNFEKALICRSSGFAGMMLVSPRVPVLSRALGRTYTGFLKTSRTMLEQRLVGQLTGTCSTYRQSVFTWDILKCNLWTQIAEQNVLDICNRMEFHHKCGAENVDTPSRATSCLKTIQPSHPFHAEPHALHSGSWSCRPQVF